MKEVKKVKEKKIAKETVKGMFEKKKLLRKQLDTIVGPQNKHTIVDQGCSWTTPLKKLCGCCLFWVLIRHPI